MEALMRAGWTEGWRDRIYPPGKWWIAHHESGYSVGEVDAGRYMIADPRGEGVLSEADDYVSFSAADDAMAYVEGLQKS
jgi:hypothetical protein